MAQALITSLAAANPVPLASQVTNYRKLTLVGCKGLNGPTLSPNAGPVYIGNSATAGQQPFIINPGDERNFDAAVGKMEDLQRWFLVVGNNGDGVVASWS